MRNHIAIGLALCLAASPVMAAGIDIADVLKRPNYRAAYETMLSGQKGLPAWMATADAVSDATTSDGSKRVIDGQEQEVFEMCKPDQCEDTGLIVIFSKNGDVAKGLLSDNDDLFFGKPTEEEKNVLLTIKNSD